MSGRLRHPLAYMCCTWRVILGTDPTNCGDGPDGPDGDGSGTDPWDGTHQGWTDPERTGQGRTPENKRQVWTPQKSILGRIHGTDPTRGGDGPFGLTREGSLGRAPIELGTDLWDELGTDP